MYLYRKKYTVDFTNVQYYSEMHKIIQKSLDFPDYYGCNWAAFWDCLTDMYGDAIHIEIIGIDVILTYSARYPHRKHHSVMNPGRLRPQAAFSCDLSDLFADETRFCPHARRYY